MAKKTISVAALKDTVNNMLVNSVNELEGERRGMANILEHALMVTGNYKGYKYLTVDEVKKGFTVGIHRDVPEEDKFKNVDLTRVMYF